MVEVTYGEEQIPQDSVVPVIEMKDEGAVSDIRRLSRKYRGTEDYPVPAGQERVTVVIRPDHVSVHA